MTNESAGSNPFNKWWWVAGGVLVIVLVLLGLIVTGVIGPTRADPAPAVPTAPSTTSVPVATATSEPAATVCDLPSGDQSIPIVGPAATWKTNIYFLHPTSEVYGPMSNPSSSSWGCFQHSPTGALFAAANVMNAGVSSDVKEAMPDAAIANAALQAYLASLTKVGQTPGQIAQLTGFQFITVSPDLVVVRLGLQQDRVTGYYTFAVVWDATTANWRADLSQSNLTPTADSLTTFTPWRAS